MPCVSEPGTASVIKTDQGSDMVDLTATIVTDVQSSPATISSGESVAYIPKRRGRTVPRGPRPFSRSQSHVRKPSVTARRHHLHIDLVTPTKQEPQVVKTKSSEQNANVDIPMPKIAKPTKGRDSTPSNRGRTRTSSRNPSILTRARTKSTSANRQQGGVL